MSLLDFAEKRELEESLYPAWCAHFAAAQILGAEPVPYTELIAKVKNTSSDTQTTKRSVDEIYTEFAPIIANHRRKREVSNG